MRRKRKGGGKSGRKEGRKEIWKKKRGGGEEGSQQLARNRKRKLEVRVEEIGRKGRRDIRKEVRRREI